MRLRKNSPIHFFLGLVLFGLMVSGLNLNIAWAENKPGNQIWTYETDGDVDSSPAIDANGTIYFGSDDDYIYALKPDGKLKWRYETNGDVDSSPAIDAKGNIYFGSDDDYIYALDPKGNRKWRYRTHDDIDSSPAIDLKGNIYIGSDDQYIYALSPDGQLKWRYKTDGQVDSSPAIDLSGTVYVGSKDEYIYALGSDGKLKWRYKTEDEVVASPAIDKGGNIYIGSLDEYIYALNPDGQLKWRYETGGGILSCPVLGDNGYIYFGSLDDHVHAIKPTGQLAWDFDTDDEIISSPVIGTNGTIYIGSTNENLQAIRSGAKQLARSIWPLFGHDHLRTSDQGRYNILALQSASARPGDPVTVKLELITNDNIPIAALSTDLDYSPSTLTNPKVNLGPASSKAEKKIMTHLIDQDTLRIVILSPKNNNPVPKGVVAELDFQVTNETKLGTITELSHNPSGSAPNGQKLTIMGNNAQVAAIIPYKLGDCDQNGQVTIPEVQSAFDMYLGKKEVQKCCDQDNDGQLSIDEVQTIINNLELE